MKDLMKMFTENKHIVHIVCVIAAIGLVYCVFKGCKAYKEGMENFTGSSGKELIYFWMDGCPHCKDFDPVWIDVCEKIKTKGELGCKKVEASEGSLAQDMGINGFPYNCIS